MSTVTDPARELAEIASRLAQGTNVVGEHFLAKQFGVDRWSTDFFKIITCILDRADLVAAIIERSDMDKDHRENARNDLAQFKAGFTGASLVQRWDQGGLRHMRDHGRPIQYLSHVTRKEISYPKLTEEEAAEFLNLIDQYLDGLRKSDEGPAFVRQGIADGLTAFRFQLERIGWMGAGYTLTAFREVLFAYGVAQHELSGQPTPDAKAFLSGLWNIIKRFKKVVDDAEGWKGTAKSAWEFYQLSSSIATPLLLSGTLQLPPT